MYRKREEKREEKKEEKKEERVHRRWWYSNDKCILKLTSPPEGTCKRWGWS